MQRLTSPARATVSYEKYGSGPPLVLVHGGFSDHKTNWEFVKPLFERQFTVYAMARRGRGETDVTEGHSLDDESMDVVALMHAIGEPLFLLGHSYGAQVALAAATVPDRVRKLVLYEPPWPHAISKEALARMDYTGKKKTGQVSGRTLRPALAQPRPGTDCLQRPLRSRFRQQLRPGVHQAPLCSA